MWWDREIHAGEAFDQAIERELAGAGAVSVLWKRSVSSDWVKNEAADAAERGVLVPALLDATKLPLEFGRRQAADLAGCPDHDGFRALCRGVATKVPAPVPPSPATAAPTASRNAPKRPVRFAVVTALLSRGPTSATSSPTRRALPSPT